MNTYLVPFVDAINCDIFKVTANSWADCKQKIMNRYIRIYEDDEHIADFDDFESFCDYITETYDVIIGTIHELDEYAQSSM